jgi:RNA polymerase sigma-70 factor (ECF subfamily)
MNQWVLDISLAGVAGGFGEAADRYFTAAGDWSIPPSEWPGPGQRIDDARFQEALARCLAALPPVEGRAFWLREAEGRSMEEICAALGITPETCSVTLYRARMLLVRGLQEPWSDAMSPSPSE